MYPANSWLILEVNRFLPFISPHLGLKWTSELMSLLFTVTSLEMRTQVNSLVIVFIEGRFSVAREDKVIHN